MNHRSSEPVHSSGELCIQLVDDASPGRCGWAPLIQTQSWADPADDRVPVIPR